MLSHWTHQMASRFMEIMRLAAEKAAAKTGRGRAPARPPLSVAKSGLPVAQHLVVAGAAAAGVAVVMVGWLGIVGAFAVDLATR
jgi:hypothetical protein